MCWLLSSTALAEEPLWQQDFEQQIPGERPAKWAYGWGNPGDDLLVISNMRSVSGRQSLLLDRMGENEAHSGCFTRLPEVTSGWAVLSWCFLVEGRGHDACFGVEVRESSLKTRVVAVGVSDRRVRLTDANYGNAVLLGTYQEAAWYRIRLWLPTAAGHQKQAWGQLEARNEEGTWELCAPRQAVPWTGAGPQYGAPMVDTTQGKRGYRLYLDDFRIEVVPLGAEGVPPA